MDFAETEHGCEYLLTTLKSSHNSRTSLLIGIPLNKGGGIQVKHQSLSSKIICEAALPFSRNGLKRLNGRVPRRKCPLASNCFRNLSQLSGSPWSPLGGTKCATVVPRSVTIIVSPLRTNPR